MIESDRLIPQPFLDWYGIWAGQTGIGESGQAWVQDPPRGVQLAVQPAQKSAIFIAPEHPWEEGSLSPQVVICAEGVLKLWYLARGSAVGEPTFVAYAESRDGFAWTRPELGLQEYGGCTRNNLLFEHRKFELQSVFVDPTAAPAERYKALGRDSIFYHKGVEVHDMTRERKWEIRRAMQAAGYTREQQAEELYFIGLLRGAVSPDGCRWKFLEEPLLDVGRTGLDSQNIAAYDADAGKYVAYLRGHQDRRRLVRRIESATFGNFAPPHPVFGMDPQDPVDDDVYSSAYCRCPGSGRQLIFPGIYHRGSARVDVQLASSRDGLLWSRPERRPIIASEPEGYGMVFAFPNLVPLGPESWGLMFIGQYDLHDGGQRHQPERAPEWRWATWKPDRLVALEAPVEGCVTLVERPCQGQQLRLNFQTREEGGWIKVELVAPPSTPAAPVEALEGFGLEDADLLRGDEISRVVSWGGRSDLGALRGRNISLRLHMARARVFSTAL